MSSNSIPTEIIQHIKAYIPNDSDMHSPTANCIYVLLMNYARACRISPEDVEENDGDVMCLTIGHFRRWFFEAVQRDRLLSAALLPISTPSGLMSSWLGFSIRR